MSRHSNPNLSQPQPLEDGIDAVLHKVEDRLLQNYRDLEHCVRQAPAKSVLTAAAAGYVLHRLPVRAILVANIRILAAVAPPALLMLGAAKLYDFLQQEAAAKHP